MTIVREAKGPVVGLVAVLSASACGGGASVGGEAEAAPELRGEYRYEATLRRGRWARKIHGFIVFHDEDRFHVYEDGTPRTRADGPGCIYHTRGARVLASCSGLEFQIQETEDGLYASVAGPVTETYRVRECTAYRRDGSGRRVCVSESNVEKTRAVEGRGESMLTRTGRSGGR